MSLVSLETLHRLERLGWGLEQLPGGDIAEVVRGDIGQQRHAHVGRRGPMRKDPCWMLLIVVGRKVMIGCDDELVEVCPGFARAFPQEHDVGARKRRLPAAWRTADPPCDRRGS